MKFFHSGTIKRLKTLEGKSTFIPHGSTACFLQPIDAETAELYALTYAKGCVIYLPYDADLIASDRITILGDEYGVKGVKAHVYGSIAHKKAVLELLK